MTSFDSCLLHIRGPSNLGHVKNYDDDDDDDDGLVKSTKLAAAAHLFSSMHSLRAQGNRDSYTLRAPQARATG